jgi:molybdate/tungstate transport system substrate-binding protein
MKAEKRTLSTKAYALIIIGVLVGAAIGFGLGYAVYVPQINSLNSKVKLQSSLVTLASNSPFAVGAAGTLAGAFGSVLTAFYEQYPSIPYAPPLFEGSGLVASTENLTKQFSLEAAADTTAMPSALFPKIANYEIAFGQTQMVVIVNLQSSAGTELYNLWKSAQGLAVMSTQWNNSWHQMFTLIALNSSTKVGISNPFTDPSGYQAAGMIRLAGLTFFNGNMSKLYDAIYDNSSRFTMQNTETNLVPLVQPDHIDFILSAYESNAIPQTGNSTQTHLAYITLPYAVNLGVLSDLSYYHLANFSLSPANFSLATSTESFVVNPVIYCVTIPIPSTNAAAANLFVQTLFNKSGQNILEQYGITPFLPGIVYGNYTAVPSPIELLTTPVNATYSSLFPSGS